jgi:hypothetical protein
MQARNGNDDNYDQGTSWKDQLLSSLQAASDRLLVWNHQNNTTNENALESTTQLTNDQPKDAIASFENAMHNLIRGACGGKAGAQELLQVVGKETYYTKLLPHCHQLESWDCGEEYYTTTVKGFTSSPVML